VVAAVTAQTVVLGAVLVVTVPVLVLERQGKEIMAASVRAILTHQAVEAALALLVATGLVQFLVAAALALHLPYQAVQLPMLAVVAVLVIHRKEIILLEQAVQVEAVTAQHLMQTEAMELQTRAVVVAEQHPTGLLLSGGLAAQA
jgi:hypothetical protein